MRIRLVDAHTDQPEAELWTDDRGQVEGDEGAQTMLYGRGGKGMGRLNVLDGNGNPVTPADGDAYLRALIKMVARSSQTAVYVVKDGGNGNGNGKLQEARGKRKARPTGGRIDPELVPGKRKRKLSEPEHEERVKAAEESARKRAEEAVRRHMGEVERIGAGRRQMSTEEYAARLGEPLPKPRPGRRQAEAPRAVRRPTFTGRRIKPEDVPSLKAGDQVRFRDGQAEGWGTVVEHRHSARAGHQLLVHDERDNQFRAVSHADVTHSRLAKSDAEREERLQGLGVQAGGHVRRARQAREDWEEELRATEQTAAYLRRVQLEAQKRAETLPKGKGSVLARRRLRAANKALDEYVQEMQRMRAQPTGQGRERLARSHLRAIANALGGLGSGLAEAPEERESRRVFVQGQGYRTLKPTVRGREPGRPVKDGRGVEKLTGGDLVRFSGPSRGAMRQLPGELVPSYDREMATVIRNYQVKGKKKLLVHVHSSNEILDVEHGQVTRAIRAKGREERRDRLRAVRTIAHGHRSATQELSPHDPERARAASHARHADQALRDLGEDVPQIEPRRMREPVEEPRPRAERRERRPSGPGIREGQMAAYLDAPHREGDPEPTDYREGRVAYNDKAARTLHIYDPGTGQVEHVPYERLHPMHGRPYEGPSPREIMLPRANERGEPIGVPLLADTKAKPTDPWKGRGLYLEPFQPEINLMVGQHDPPFVDKERTVPHDPAEHGTVEFEDKIENDLRHPRHLRAGDQVMFADGQIRGDRPSGSRQGVVLEHNKKARTLGVWSPSEHRARVVPYAHVHHVMHLDRNDRLELARSRVGGRAKAPLLAAIEADKGSHRRLVNERGHSAWFRSPAWIGYQNDRAAGVAHHWPAARDDSPYQQKEKKRRSGQVDYVTDERARTNWMSGGIPALIEYTDKEGNLREAEALREAKRGGHSGAMVALYPSPAAAKKLAVPGGEKPEQLHVTLGFLGDATKLKDPGMVKSIVKQLAERHPPLSGALAGHGVFTHGEDAPVTIAHVNLPALPGFRQKLVRLLHASGHTPSSQHGFTPHMTLAYGTPNVHVPAEPITFDKLTLRLGDERHDFPFAGHLREANAKRKTRFANREARDGIPRIGLGTSELPGEKAYEPTLKALKNGYRHIDTAAYYKNEEQVGRAIKRSGVPRGQIHLTTKVWTDRFDDPYASLTDSLKKLGTDHVDLLHAHWPKKEWTRTDKGDKAREELAKLMRGLQMARQSGKARRIGVSNFPRELMTLAHSFVPIDAIQVEGHPHLYQPDLMDAAHELGAHVTLYAPLGSGRGVLADPVLNDVAQREGITPAQAAIAWVLNVADSTPPRSEHDEHQLENLAVTPEMLSPASVRELSSNALNVNRRYFNGPEMAPNWDWAPYAKG
jgi:2,5-diketo-D-gluconate reductase B